MVGLIVARRPRPNLLEAAHDAWQSPLGTDACGSVYSFDFDSLAWKVRMDLATSGNVRSHVVLTGLTS